MRSALSNFPPMLLEGHTLDLDEPGWLFELKYDGYRMTARFGDGKCQLRTRNGADCTTWFPEVSKSLAAIKGGPYVTDGEVCVLDEFGRSDFDRLHDRARRRRWYEGADPVVYCIFGLLAEGNVIRINEPLHMRKSRLAMVLGSGALPPVLIVGHFETLGRKLLEEAVHQLNLEGLVAKRANSPYRPGLRSSDWVKISRNDVIAAD